MFIENLFGSLLCLCLRRGTMDYGIYANILLATIYLLSWIQYCNLGDIKIQKKIVKIYDFEPT